MLPNHVSACSAKFTMNGLQFALWAHPNVHYLVKSIRINKPAVIKNILLTFPHYRILCSNVGVPRGGVQSSVLFSLLIIRFQTLPRSPYPHLTPGVTSVLGDLILTKNFLKVIWRGKKTIRDRNKVLLLIFPRAKGSKLYPYQACTQVIKLYSPASNDLIPESENFSQKLTTNWV